MLKKFLDKFQKKSPRSPLDIGTEKKLAHAFSEEIAYRNYRDFMDKAIKYFEKHGDKTDIPSYIKAQTLFNVLKRSGELDELNRPVKASV